MNEATPGPLSDAAIRAITFDATGTLIHAPRLVEIYVDCFERHQRPVTAEALRGLIPDVWREFDLAHVAGVERFAAHPGGAEGWWGRFIARICERLELEPPTRFLVRELFDRFGRAESWQLFPEVERSLEELREAGLRFAVVSNWDHRLPGVLDGLGLDRWIETVVYSAAIGVEKPHRAIFDHAVAELELEPHQVVHVGDRRRNDLEGAQAAGLGALHLDRWRDRGDLRDLAELPCLVAPYKGTASR